jgi:hypothetical protein
VVVFALTAPQTPRYRLESTDVCVLMDMMANLAKTKTVSQEGTRRVLMAALALKKALYLQNTVMTTAFVLLALRDTGASKRRRTRPVLVAITRGLNILNSCSLAEHRKLVYQQIMMVRSARTETRLITPRGQLQMILRLWHALGLA